MPGKIPQCSGKLFVLFIPGQKPSALSPLISACGTLSESSYPKLAQARLLTRTVCEIPALSTISPWSCPCSFSIQAFSCGTIFRFPHTRGFALWECQICFRIIRGFQLVFFIMISCCWAFFLRGYPWTWPSIRGSFSCRCLIKAKINRKLRMRRQSLIFGVSYCTWKQQRQADPLSVHTFVQSHNHRSYQTCHRKYNSY